MQKGFLGQYTYIAMTKVDIYEHKNQNIKATAVHEYIHASLVRSTLYGNFMQSIESVNKIDNKYEKIIKKLYANEEKLQETTATLIELLYIWYEDGFDVMNDALKNLSDPYNKYILKYKHILNETYIMEIYKEYIKSIEKIIKDNENDFELHYDLRNFIKSLEDGNEEKTALNLIQFLIMRTAGLAMTVDLLEIDESLWNTEKKITRYICNQHANKYYPNSRFDKCMKHIFSEVIRDTNDRFILDDIISMPDKVIDFKLYNTKDFISEKYSSNSENKNIIENTLDEYIYIQAPLISTFNDLEKEALIYAIPYPLNEESANKLFGENYWVYNAKAPSDIMPALISKQSVLHIHPSTGNKEKYSYDICLNTITNPKILDYVRFNKDDLTKGDLSKQTLEIKCKIDSLDELLNLLIDYHGTIYITGCQRSSQLIEALENQNKNRKLLINSVASLTSSLDFINEYFTDLDAEIISTHYTDFLLIENKNKVFIQYLMPSITNKLLELKNDNRLNLNQILLKEKSDLHPLYLKFINLYTELNMKNNCTYSANKFGFGLAKK